MLMLLGGADDYTPAAACRDYAGWFAAKGMPVEVIAYAGAYHDFDIPDSTALPAGVAKRPRLQGGSRGRQRHRATPRHRRGPARETGGDFGLLPLLHAARRDYRGPIG